MNGAALPFAHGFPARLIVPGLYGYVSATKWVTELEVTRFDRAEAYWTRRGWSAQAPIKHFSRIDVPGPRPGKAGLVAVAGVAWAQHRGVGVVEVRVDGGTGRTPLGRRAEHGHLAAVGVDLGRRAGLHRLQVRVDRPTGDPQPGYTPPIQARRCHGLASVTVTVT